MHLQISLLLQTANHVAWYTLSLTNQLAPPNSHTRGCDSNRQGQGIQLLFNCTLEQLRRDFNSFEHVIGWCESSLEVVLERGMGPM